MRWEGRWIKVGLLVVSHRVSYLAPDVSGVVLGDSLDVVDSRCNSVAAASTTYRGESDATLLCVTLGLGVRHCNSFATARWSKCHACTTNSPAGCRSLLLLFLCTRAGPLTL